MADLFSGNGDSGSIGAYLALADQMTEWCTTGSATPHISKEELADLVTQFGSLEGATLVAMKAYSVPFLELLTKVQYIALVGGPGSTSRHD